MSEIGPTSIVALMAPKTKELGLQNKHSGHVGVVICIFIIIIEILSKLIFLILLLVLLLLILFVFNYHFYYYYYYHIKYWVLLFNYYYYYHLLLLRGLLPSCPLLGTAKNTSHILQIPNLFIDFN